MRLIWLYSFLSCLPILNTIRSSILSRTSLLLTDYCCLTWNRRSQVRTLPLQRCFEMFPSALLTCGLHGARRCMHAPRGSCAVQRAGRREAIEWARKTALRIRERQARDGARIKWCFMALGEGKDGKEGKSQNGYLCEIVDFIKMRRISEPEGVLERKMITVDTWWCILAI